MIRGYMGKLIYIYKDMRNYAPINADKGIDLITGKVVKADDIMPSTYIP